MPPPARVRVKFCGVTCEEDLAAAVAAGCDAVGFNFHRGSPRYITPGHGRELVRLLPPFVEAVGVFVGHTVEQALATLDGTGIRAVQIHGAEPEAVEVMPKRYWPAFAVREQADLDAVLGYLRRCDEQAPAAVLLDGHAPGMHGGTGRAVPWELLAGWACPVPFILAGGLTPDNVAEAVRAVRPYAVDVASGIESEPGRKDPAKMRRFVEQVLAAGGPPQTR